MGKYPAENYQSDELVFVEEEQSWSIPDRIKLRPLTTPVSYVSSIPEDPFADATDILNSVSPPTYHYVSINDPLHPGSTYFFRGANEEGLRFYWMTQSNGPDKRPTPWQFPRYDATNGTMSVGNVIRSGP